VRVHRGWLQISLIGGAIAKEERLGYLMRRQIGLLAYAGVDEDKRGTSVTPHRGGRAMLYGPAAPISSRAPFRPTISRSIRGTGAAGRALSAWYWLRARPGTITRWEGSAVMTIKAIIIAALGGTLLAGSAARSADKRATVSMATGTDEEVAALTVNKSIDAAG